MPESDREENRLHHGYHGNPGSKNQSAMPNLKSSNQGYGSITADGNDESKMHFYLAVLLLEFFGLIALIFVGVWMSHFRGGFKWNGSGHEFNYHPVFMVTGMVFLYGNAMIVYRVFRTQSKFRVKLLHGAIQLCVIVFFVLGLVTVFDFHNMQKIPNMYSLHSWLGMGTVVLFCLQFLFGGLGFLYPKFSVDLRAQYLKVHQYFGVGIFLLAICSCLTGITEKLLFSVSDYSKFVAEGNMANTLGLALVIFAGLVLVVVLTPGFRRPPDEGAEYAPIQGNQ